MADYVAKDAAKVLYRPQLRQAIQKGQRQQWQQGPLPHRRQQVAVAKGGNLPTPWYKHIGW